MAWKFERVAGPFGGPTGGLVWDGKTIVFAAVLESRLLRYDPAGGGVEAFSGTTTPSRRGPGGAATISTR